MSEYVYSPHINVRSITFFETLDADGNGTGTPAARLSLFGGVLTLQTWGDLKIIVQGSAQVEVQQDANIQVTGNCAATIGGHQTTQVDGLHRTEAAQVERHASEHLKDDANGVGHTYTGSAAHYWVPLEGGTSNWPHPPEHPLYGSDNLAGPKP